MSDDSAAASPWPRVCSRRRRSPLSAPITAPAAVSPHCLYHLHLPRIQGDEGGGHLPAGHSHNFLAPLVRNLVIGHRHLRQHYNGWLLQTLLVPDGGPLGNDGSSMDFYTVHGMAH